MITHARKIDMYPASVPVVIHLSQYDDDFTIEFTLYSSVGTFTVESGTTAKIRGTKKDGNGYSANASINTTQKKVTVTGNQQMTAVAGRNVYELVLTKNNKVLSTANFILDVEPAAMDASTVPSESVIQEISEAVNAYLDEHDIIVDPTLTQSGKAADAKKTGDEIADLKSDLLKIFSDDAKAALLDCFAHVAWIGTDGRDYYDALEDALYDDIVLPEGYEKSKYIEGTGQQYIATPINSAIPMELEVELNLAEIDNGIYFGASNGGNSRFFFLGTQQYRPTDARVFFSSRFSDTNYTDPDTGLARAWLPLMGFELATNRKYIVKSGIAWNQDSVTTYIESEGYRAEIDRKIPTVGYPIIIGGDFWGGSTFKGLKAKIYRCKIKSGNNTLFDGVPCKRDADNKYGLYDIVNNVFYASSGSADYIGGEE